MTIIIQPGKRYVTRGGDIAAVTARISDFRFPLSGIIGRTHFDWHATGRYSDEGESSFDLISEYTEPSAEGATGMREYILKEMKLSEEDIGRGSEIAPKFKEICRLALERLDQIEAEKPNAPTEAEKIARICVEENRDWHNTALTPARVWQAKAAARILREIVQPMIVTAYGTGIGNTLQARPRSPSASDYAARTIAAAIGDEP